MGAEVTVIEFAERLCPTMDKGVIEGLRKSLVKQGMKFMFQTKVTNSTVTAKGVTLDFENMADQSKGSFEADVVLVATGRKAFTDNLGIKELGVQMDARGVVQIDDHFQTNVPGIYAVGDIVRGPMLAHKAEEEGVAIAEILAGHYGHVNYHTVPGIIYTHPEVASIGYSEEQLKEKGIEYNAGQFAFAPNGRARAKGSTDGFVKILADKTTDKILGAHIVGPMAGELIHELVVAMEFGGSSEDVARSFHGHPTLSEVIREAALAVDKRARQA